MYRNWKRRISQVLIFAMAWSLLSGIMAINRASAAEEGTAFGVSGMAVDWDSVSALGSSVQKGWEGFQLSQLKLTNDDVNLYFRVTGVKVESWQNINIALNVNDVDSGQSGNPLNQNYRFVGPIKPQYQIVLDAGSKIPRERVGLYRSNQLSAPVISAADPQGAVFNGHDQTGFEGSVPLKLLGLHNGDQVKGIVVLSGDNYNEHGAFDIIPESGGNHIATSWNEKDHPNEIADYSDTYTVAMNYSPSIGGGRDSVWDAVYTLGSSVTDNTYGGNPKMTALKITNDHKNMYFRIDANVPNWGDDGQFVDIVLQVNEQDSGVIGNPWGAQFNFAGTDKKPQYHLVMRAKRQQGVERAELYAASNLSTPVLTTLEADRKGAEFAIDIQQGFEASIPLSVLGLKNLDRIRAIAVLSGNKLEEHGAFNVIPEHPLNTLASSWNESAHPNVQSIYSSPYTVTGYTGKLDIINTVPANQAVNAQADAPLKVVFTENIRIVNEAGIGLQDDQDRPVAVTSRAEGKQLLIQPAQPLAYQTKFTVKLAANAVVGTDTATSIAEERIFTFTTKATPSVSKALVDRADQVQVVLSDIIAGLDYSKFVVYDGTKKLEGTSAKGAEDKLVTICLSEPIADVNHPYTVHYEGEQTGVYPAQSLTMRSILDSYIYEGNDLGVMFTPAKSGFKVWAPTAKQVSVALYDSPTAAKDNPTKLHLMTRDAFSGVWAAEVQGNLNGTYYMYKVEFPDGMVTYALDPYARASSVNSTKSAVVDLKATDPAHWDPDTKPPMVEPTDAILYELHVRDFSMDEQSGITAQNRGKFKAFTETGTTLPGKPDIKTGIGHLKELGITHVHLLPFYDFGSIDESKVDDPNAAERKFNWGYDPVSYNVPEGSYATNSSQEDPAKRIREMKEMVQALHDQGIRIVLDVVYNHTYTHGLESDFSVFDKLVPGYYYRSDEKGSLTNGSGTGNEVASERPMVSKFIKDSVKYLAGEYNVDGFRFDLMGLLDLNTMTDLTKELKQADPSMIVYGEPWDAGSNGLPPELQTKKGKQKGLGFAVFNDNIRGAIKGGSDDDSKGFATGAGGMEGDIVKGVQGSTSDFTDSPTETINYVTAHDNLNLWDKVLKTQHKDANIKNNPFETLTEADVLMNETVKRSLLANGIVLTSQGIPFMHAGDELLRSKFGDHNSYQSPDRINKIVWKQKAAYKPVFDYVQGLIELRKTHPAFRMTTKEAVRDGLHVIKQQDQIIAFQLKEFANGDAWRNIVVIYNGNETAKEAPLPSNTTWNVVVDHTGAGVRTLRTIDGNKAKVEGLSMMVLYDQAIDYTPVATTIEVLPKHFGLEPGTSKVLSAVVKDQKGKPMTAQQAVWTSSDSTVAGVTATGKVTAKMNGQATITASTDSVQGSALVEVTALVPTAIKLTGADKVYAGRTTSMFAAVQDQFGQEMLNVPLQWSSSDTSIASVDRMGKVTGVAEGTATVTVKAGNAQASKIIAVKPLVKRYVQVNYVRQDRQFDGWNIWAWQTGVKDGQIDFNAPDGNTVKANIEIGPDTESIGFIIRKGDWEAKDPDADRYIKTNTLDTVTKIYSYSGQVPFKTIPSVNGPVLEDGNISFIYRDEDTFLNGGVERIKDVKVKVNGQLYSMTYLTEEERYAYTLPNVASGTYTYTFLVTKDGRTTEINDPKNTVNGKSTVTYSKPDVTVAANVEPNTIYAGQNRILSVNVQSAQPINMREIYADLSALGGPSRVQIDQQLMKHTIAVQDNVSPGAKTIPIVAVDAFGNKHMGSASLTVQQKPQSNGKLDFDWDEARIYFALTDRFYDGDPGNNGIAGEDYDKSHPEAYHGGDFRGLIDKLDYLQELGVNTLWITPIVDNIKFNKGVDFGSKQYAYHGYWARNFEQLDEHLGDLDTFKELIDKAHDRGIKLMVDVVLNHTGYGLKPEDRRPGITDEDKQRFAGMLRTDGVSADENAVRGEVAGLPDFMTEIPEVRDKIIQWQFDWLDRARTNRGDTIDYFRVDTVKHVDDTTWKAFKNKLTESYPNFKLIGEYFGASVDNTGTYLDSGEMDSLLDFNFKSRARDFVNGSIDATEQALQDRENRINNTAMLGQFLSSHDEDGFLSHYLNGDKGKLMVAAALQITSKGQPVIYYGEELGRSGKNSGDMAKGEFSENRGDMPWDKWTEEKFLHNHYQKLLNIRGAHSKLLSKGTRSKIAGGDAQGYLVIDKTYENEHLVIGLNTKASAQDSVTFKVPFAPQSVVTEEYSGTKYTVDGQGRVTLTIPGKDQGGTIILAKQKAIDPTDPATSEKPFSGSSSQGGMIPNPTKASEYQTTQNGVTYTPARTVTITDLQGNRVTQATLDASAVEKALTMLDQRTEGKELTVIAADSTNTRIVLSGAALEALQNYAALHQSFKMRIQTVNVKYELPLQAMDIHSWARMLNVEESKLSAFVKIMQASDEMWEQIAKAAAAKGATVLGKAYEFELGAEAGGKQILLSDFGHQYMEREMTVPGAVDANKATAVVFDPGTKQLTFVPAKLQINGNETRVTMKRNGNSIYAVIQSSPAFADLASHWAKQDIETLGAKLIVQGNHLSQFAPNRTVTRAEFATMLVRALGLSASNAGYPSAFTDVADTKWYAKDIRIAAEAKLVQGFGDGTFRPNAEINREQLAQMISNALRYIAPTISADQAVLSGYKDAAKISPKAQDALAISSAAHIITGFADQTIRPEQTASRAEAAVMLKRMLEHLDFINK